MRAFSTIDELRIPSSQIKSELKRRFGGCLCTGNKGNFNAFAVFLVQMGHLGWPDFFRPHDSMEITLLSDEFKKTYISEIIPMQRTLEQVQISSPILPLSAIADHFSLHITLFSPSNPHSEVYKCQQSERYLKVYLLSNRGELNVLLTKRVIVGLESVMRLGKRKVLELEWKQTRKSGKRMGKENEEKEREKLECLSTAFTVFTSILGHLKTIITDFPSFQLYKNPLFAQLLIYLFNPLSRFRSTLKDTFKSQFLALCTELASNTVPYHFILACENPECEEKGLVSVVMKGCGHMLCIKCGKLMCDSEDWRCFCGQRQGMETVKRDLEVYESIVSRENRKIMKCSVCKRVKTASDFVFPMCCEKTTCRSCLQTQIFPQICRFCTREITFQPPKPLQCDNCEEISENCTTCDGLDALCPVCQFKSICNEECVKCHVRYSSEKRENLIKTTVFRCWKCEENGKKWTEMVRQTACGHLICTYCYLNQSQNNCELCYSDFASDLYFAYIYSLNEKSCISCRLLLQEGNANAYKLTCGHFIHMNCIQNYLSNSYFQCALCRSELDHSLLIEHRYMRNVEEYICERGLEWHLVCPVNGYIEDLVVSLAYDNPEHVQCTVCSKLVCGLCGEFWEEEHLCPFAIAYRMIREIEQKPGKKPAQCPICLYVSELDLRRDKVIFTCENCGVGLCSGCLVPEVMIHSHGMAYHSEACPLYPRDVPGLTILRCEYCRNRLEPCDLPRPLTRPLQFTPAEYQHAHRSYLSPS